MATRVLTPATRHRPSVLTDGLLVATARALVRELPLRAAPAPLLGRDHVRGDWASARRELECALAERAVTAGLAVDVAETAEALAARLARARVVPAGTADAVAALAPVLRRGETGCGDESLAVAACRVAERLAGSLRG